MFDEFDELEESKEERRVQEPTNYEPMFVIENIKSKDIGKKIKRFAKIFIKIDIACLILFGCVFFISICANAEMLGAGIMLALLMMFFGLFFAFFVAYYIFLIATGFGTLIEDVNAIRNSATKQTKTTKKVSNSVK